MTSNRNKSTGDSFLNYWETVVQCTDVLERGGAHKTEKPESTTKQGEAFAYQNISAADKPDVSSGKPPLPTKLWLEESIRYNDSVNDGVRIFFCRALLPEHRSFTPFRSERMVTLFQSLIGHYQVRFAELQDETENENGIFFSKGRGMDCVFVPGPFRLSTALWRRSITLCRQIRIIWKRKLIDSLVPQYALYSSASQVKSSVLQKTIESLRNALPPF